MLSVGLAILMAINTQTLKQLDKHPTSTKSGEVPAHTGMSQTTSDIWLPD